MCETRAAIQWIDEALHFSGSRAARSCLLLLAASCQLCAIDRDLRLDQLYHRSWTAKDGAPTSVRSIVQTPDGFLWFGGHSGLYRFDGVRFERIDAASGVALPQTSVSTLSARPDGGLLIGWWLGGASLLRDGVLQDYGAPASGFPDNGKIFALRADAEGGVWAWLDFKGILRLNGRARWEALAAPWPLPGNPNTFLVDRRGTLWIGSNDGVFFLPRGATKYQRVPSPVLGIAESPDDTIWAINTHNVGAIAPDGRGVQIFDTKKVGDLALPLLADSAGSLWMAGVNHGIVRIPHPERGLTGETVRCETFAASDGLSGDFIDALFQDREGNVWVATAMGVDQFRQSNVVPVHIPESRSFMFFDSIDRAIRVAAVIPSGLVTVDGGSISKEPMPIHPLYIYRKPRGPILIATTDHGIFRWVNGHAEPIETPGSAVGAITEDAKGRLWAIIPNAGLLRMENGKWTTKLADFGGPLTGTMTDFTDSRGHVWFGFIGNRVGLLIEDKLTMYSSRDGIGVGAVLDIREAAGRIFISGEAGVEMFDGNRFVPVLPNDRESFLNNWALIASEQSGLWFAESRGIVQIPKIELEQIKGNPRHRVAYKTFDALDGLSTEPQRSGYRPASMEGADGRIWFATYSNDLVWIDPKRILRNPVAPGVFVQSISANGKTYNSLSTVKLAARTTAAHITFTATSLCVPERVRFRYKLEGVDDGWQDSGTRRETSYTNLGPRTYRFRVIACNEDGVWNESGAAFTFIILPTYYQTLWFEALCVLALVALLMAAYRFRLRQIADAMNARFDERLTERTRIARDFHDTLLQTIQGSKMVVDTALRTKAGDREMLGTLERLSGWLDQAVQEGRAALSSLRESTTERNDLAEALRRACEECAFHRPMEFDVSIAGSGKEMHPIARDEVYRIGYEAIRNACNHSNAGRLTVELSYLADLVLRIRDNGKGFDTETAELQSGHYGLVGMQERAARIGGRLTISSSPDDGTLVELVVPGSVVFHEKRATRRPAS